MLAPPKTLCYITTMKATKHPAFALFDALFEKASRNPGPVRPQYFVTRSIFHSECRKAGIDCPEAWIAALEWEDRIGLSKHVKKVVRRYVKSITKT